MKQIFLASTFFELVCLAAGIDSGVYDTTAAPALLGTGGVATGGDGAAEAVPGSTGTAAAGAEPATDRERILLVSNNAAVVELARPLTESPGAERLLTRFDRVIDLNAAVAPSHPTTWTPSAEDLPMIEENLRTQWDLGDGPIELVLESPQVNPAIALGRVFSTATIRVHADGLMSYGPTRNKIPLANGQRMSTLHYLPLVPGLEPRLLAEFGIVVKPMDLGAFRRVVDELGEATAGELDAVLADAVLADAVLADAVLAEVGPGEPVSGEPVSGDSGAGDSGTAASGTAAPDTAAPDTAAPDAAEPWAFAVGQYLAALGLLSEDEETALHVEMIEQAAGRGFSRVVFKPHPAAPPAQLEPLFAAAERLGIRLTVLDLPVLAEVVVSRLRPGLIIGGFSTALATAREIYGVPALAVGTGALLAAVRPYQNSNRIPLTIIAEMCDGSDPTTHPAPAELGDLVAAVTYCMGAEVSRDLRPRAVAFLEKHFGPGGDERFRRYFTRRRLTSLRLPGGHQGEFTPRAVARSTGRLALLAVRRQQRRLTDRWALRERVKEDRG